jgi:hypothetical protein
MTTFYAQPWPLSGALEFKGGFMNMEMALKPVAGVVT